MKPIDKLLEQRQVKEARSDDLEKLFKSISKSIQGMDSADIQSLSVSNGSKIMSLLKQLEKELKS